jgi:group I intron endonuclease
MYIGSAVNLRKRRNEHFSALGRGAHFNVYMQRHCNTHGIDDFVFSILELCDKEDLIEREQYYVDNTDCDIIFNMHPVVNSMLGFKHSEESKIKMRESHNESQVGAGHPMYGRPGPMTGVFGEDHPMYGHAGWLKGITGPNHPSFGAKRSKEARQRISDAVKKHWIKRKLLNKNICQTDNT